MSVLQHFEEYQKARVKFVQAVAEAATRPQNIEVMNNAGVMQLLRPLLLDNVSTFIGGGNAYAVRARLLGRSSSGPSHRRGPSVCERAAPYRP